MPDRLCAGGSIGKVYSVPDIYHDGFVASPSFRNGKLFHGVELPLGVDFGGPLFFAHYSFCGLDPRGLRDRHADYWEQNVRHARINHAHCVANPHGFKGYGPDCWGLTASHGPRRYGAHSPLHDIGVITPSAALSSFPYLPRDAMCALRGFLQRRRIASWGRYGFVDAFGRAQLVCAHLSRHRPGTDRRDDREPSHRAVVAAVHAVASSSAFSKARL
jgi:hypothetical protein